MFLCIPGADRTRIHVASTAMILAGLLAAGPVSAQHDLTLHATAGASLQGWSSGLTDTAVKIETESLQALRLEGRLAYRGLTLLSLAHARTLDDSPQQAEMLAASVDQSSALAQTLGVLDLLALISAEARAGRDEMTLWDLLFSLRFSYKHNLYFGSTLSRIDFAYVGFGAPDDPVVIKDGAQLSFRTRFRDLRIVAPLWFNPSHPGALARIGYFHSRWEKVADVTDETYDSRPVVYDTRRDTGGLTLGYEHNLDLPGLGFGLSVDWGFVGSGLTTPVEPDEDAPTPTYGAFRSEIRFNAGRSDGSSGPSATLGAAFEFRSWQVSGQKIDRDVLTRVFGRVGFDIVL